MQIFFKLTLFIASTVLIGCQTPYPQNTHSPAPPTQYGTPSYPPVQHPPYPHQHPQVQPRPNSQSAHCQAQGGRMQIAGLAGGLMCIIPYRDGGQTCSDSTQCQGKCTTTTSNYNYRIPNQNTRTTGQCTMDSNPFGCYSEVRNGVAEPALCVD